MVEITVSSYFFYVLFLYISSMFEIHIINTGYIMADGGAMFGAIPKRAWQRKYPADENNLCPLVMRCILAVSDKKKILVDTGLGNKFLDQISYYQPHKLESLEDSLHSLGYTPDDITDVVLTHLHFDHCGGATFQDEDKSIVPSFPKAKYWLSEKQWKNYLLPNRLERDSIFEANIVPVFDAGQLFFVEENMTICEGVEIRLFNGHSEGQLVPYIQTSEGVCTFPGDLIPTAAHVPLEWISAYDISAITALKEKERFLSEAEKEEYVLIYCHDSKTAKSKVKRLNDDYAAKKL